MEYLCRQRKPPRDDVKKPFYLATVALLPNERAHDERYGFICAKIVGCFDLPSTYREVQYVQLGQHSLIRHSSTCTRAAAGSNKRIIVRVHCRYRWKLVRDLEPSIKTPVGEPCVPVVEKKSTRRALCDTEPTKAAFFQTRLIHSSVLQKHAPRSALFSVAAPPFIAHNGSCLSPSEPSFSHTNIPYK